MKKKLFYTIIISILFISSCNRQEKPDDLVTESFIKIGYSTYPSSIAGSYLAKILLEEEGYDVKLVEVASEGLIEAVASKEVDVILSCWLPDIDYHKYKEFNNDFVDLGANYKNSNIGIYVTDNSLIVSSEELRLQAPSFNNIIFVPKESKYLVEVMNSWISENQLNYEVIALAERDIKQKLEKGIKENAWVLFAAWSPHAILAEYPLRSLEDTGIIGRYPQEIHTLINAKIKDDKLISLLKNIYLEEREMNELLSLINNHQEENYEIQISKWVEKQDMLKQRLKKQDDYTFRP